VKNLMCLISLVLMFGVHTNAHSQIEIFGISWEQDNHKSIVENKGYQCVENTQGGYLCLNKNFSDIAITTEFISFPCELFNGCRSSMHEIRDSIISADVVKSLDYYPPSEALSRPARYCTRGAKGDELCVEDWPPFGTKIVLYKGEYGSGGMSFN